MSASRDLRLQAAIDSLVHVVMEMREEVNLSGNVYTLDELIALQRDAWGFSLQDVADRTGISKPHIHALEQGKTRNPNVSTILALARAFKVPPEQIFLAAERSLTTFKDSAHDR